MFSAKYKLLFSHLRLIQFSTVIAALPKTIMSERASIHSILYLQRLVHASLVHYSDCVLATFQVSFISVELFNKYNGVMNRLGNILLLAL